MRLHAAGHTDSAEICAAWTGPGTTELPAEDGARRTGIVGRVLISAVRIYQAALSPLLGPCCRFSPSCSEYCIEAIATHGAVGGLRLGVKRELKCHPFHEGGPDPVPPLQRLRS